MRAGVLPIVTLLATVTCAMPCRAAPERIVSINLCTDELLLALAEPAQIAALSPFAADPSFSLSAGHAEAFRHDAASAETVVALQPDLILSGRYSNRSMRDILGRLSFRVVEFDVAPGIDASETQIMSVADLVGQPARGEELVARIEAARGTARAAAPPGPRPTAVVYQRRGFVSGGATLTSELLDLVGIEDISALVAGVDGGFVPLEEIVAHRPDFLVVTSPSLLAEDQGSALLAHPALTELYPPDRRIVLPEALTVCGGPSLVDAIQWLAREAARVTHPGSG